MPATANIVIADAVPTNHTYKPRSASLALSTWAESSAATYEGNGRLAIVMSQPTASRRTTREKLTLSIPIERTVDSVISVQDTITYILEAIIPATCSDAEANNAYTQFKNLMSNALVLAYLAQREPVY